MPRRNDLHRILVPGSGPIVIGQACEFDYSGTQAAKALRADGYEVVLVNSNPATHVYGRALWLPARQDCCAREFRDGKAPSLHGRLQIGLLRFFDERIHHIGLTAAPQFIA